jgi:hypothetical protein
VLDALAVPSQLSRGALLLLGVALLVAGRRLFWLGVGALGFLAGLAAAERLAPELPAGTTLLVALAAGVVGLVLAVVVQKVAVGLAGFLLGVIVLVRVLPVVGLDLGRWQWLLLAAGGLLAAFAALAIFEVALTVLTAGVGAALVAEALPLSGALAPLLLLVLWGVGVAVQLGRGGGGTRAKP